MELAFPVKDLITRKPVTATQNSTILDAAQVMSAHKIGLVVVVDARDKEKVLGVVSERDIVHAIAKGESLGRNVMNIAKTKVITVGETEGVGKAQSLMTVNGIRHLVVVKDSWHLSGVVSIRDIVSGPNWMKS